MRAWIVILVSLVGYSVALSKSDRKKKAKSQLEPEVKEADDEHRHLGDLKFPPASVNKESILEDEQTVDSSERTFQNPTLAYITPWNNCGYDLAKWIAQKLTHVSPVWLQLKAKNTDEEQSCQILGTHDIDHGWMNDVRANNSAIKIVPRVLFDDWSPEDMSQFLTNERWALQCRNDLINFLTRNQFDGAVVELWMSIMSVTQGGAAPYLVELLVQWGDGFHDKGLEIIVPVGPPLGANNQMTGMFTVAYLQAMVRSIDYIQVMTYDYPGGAGVAPLKWVEKSIEVLTEGSPVMASRIMIGINYYGYHYTKKGAEAVTRGKYLELLEGKNSVLEWDDEVAEHRILLTNSLVYYPSLTSIELRLNVARKYGVGIGIWDLGQGLNYFTKLL